MTNYCIAILAGYHALHTWLYSVVNCQHSIQRSLATYLVRPGWRKSGKGHKIFCFFFSYTAV